MKNEIIKAAQKVFNENGIPRSTLRDIAKELSISDGHLRYYFKTKEDLILAIFGQMDEEIVSFAQGGQPSNSLQAIIGPLTGGFEVMYNYAFFFTESTALLEVYPKVYAAYQNLIENRRKLFLTMFGRFKEKGIFLEDSDESLFPIIFEQFFIISDNWVKYAKMEEGKDIINHYVALAVALFIPYFNSQLKVEALKWIKSLSSGRNKI